VVLIAFDLKHFYTCGIWIIDNSRALTKGATMRTLIKTTIVSILVLFSSIVFATQSDIDAEIDEYTRIFKNDNFQEQRRVIDKLFWAGHSSAAFYDVIADQLVALKDNKDKESKEKASWYAKSLALSGNEKYRTVLQSVAEDAKAKKVRKYAGQALTRLDNHKNWNAVISLGLVDAPAGRLEETRVKNMLAAEDHALLRIGAKRVYHGHKNDKELISVAKQRLEAEYKFATDSNGEQVDAIAWLIKAMAESGDRENRPLLQKIGEESKIKKIRKYAQKYAEYLN